MPFSQYLADSTLNWFRGSTFVAAPAPGASIYVSIHTGDPGLSGVNNDVTAAVAGGRGALPVSALSQASSAAGGGRQISNTTAVSLSASAPGSAKITHFGLWSAGNGGNFLAYGLLTTPVDVFVGDVLEFPTGQLVIRGI